MRLIKLPQNTKSGAPLAQRITTIKTMKHEKRCGYKVTTE